MLRKVSAPLTIAAVVLLSLCSTFAEGQSAQRPPIKIGMLIPLSGPSASTCNDGKLAVQMFLDQVGGQIAGRKVELIVEDTSNQPKTALEKARKLVESDKVHMITGINLSSEALALRDYLEAQKVPLIITLFGGAQELSFERKSPYILRTSLFNGADAYGIAKYASEKLGYKRFVVMGADYVAGREKADTFKAVTKTYGAEIVHEAYTALGTKDYAPYLTAMKSADALFTFYAPADGLKFVSQYAEFGLKDRLPIITVPGLVNSVTLPDMGDNVLGITMCNYLSALTDFPDKPDYVKFAAEFQKRYGHPPQDGGPNGYTGMQVISQALDAVKGNVEAVPDFLQAVKNVKFEAMFSPWRMEPETNSASFNYRVYRFDKKDGKVGFTTLEVYKDVGPSVVAPYMKKN